MKKDYINLVYKNLKSSAKRRGIEFNLTKEDIDDIGLPLRCPILDIPLKFNSSFADDDSYSFDRIDSSKGYTRDNLVVISLRANKLKNNASLEELQKIAQFYTELYESRSIN